MASPLKLPVSPEIISSEVGIMNFLAFFLYSVVVTFTPGPTNIVILSLAQNRGPRRTMHFVAGATLAFATLLTISAALNSALFTLTPKIRPVMEIAGAAYMLYLACKIAMMDISGGQDDHGGGFASGFFMQFVNPKVIMFTLTVLSNFVIPHYDSAAQVSLFVGVITVIGFAAFMAWVMLGTLLKRFLAEHRRLTNRALALFMVYCAYVVSGAKNYLTM